MPDTLLTLSELDQWLLAEGTHQRPYTQLGAHPCQIDGVAGVRFAVWAPNARRVAVVGDFNHWDAGSDAMHLHRNCGIWERFIPGAKQGDLYKFAVEGAYGGTVLKADPFALRAQLRPDTASIVHVLPASAALPPARRAANAKDAPISIYEVHLGSWRRNNSSTHDGKSQQWLSYRELAEQLVPYARDLGFTHIELMPINEHPFDGSWGYQPTGLYAATSRFGTPEDLRHFVQTAHAAGLGVLLDWVPGHFPTDAHGLAQWDGSHLYEHADPREGWHHDWNTLIYNFGRVEVANFLVANARFWIECFGFDGLRVDAVASMLYRDYSRKQGEWIPNHYGGRENLEAIALLRQVNQNLSGIAGAITLAEESTSFPGVSHPVEQGGLGFSYKWNMGWMHDTLKYMQQDPLHRKHHHDQMTFGMVYAYSENFVLPLSHDEVVHGKGSLLGKMPGDEWQRFANLRAYYGFMWGHPGKKLLFMGGEFAQVREWQHDYSLDWHLLESGPAGSGAAGSNTVQPLHQGVQRLIRDLNTVYRDWPALHQLDCVPRGFAWLVQNDRDNSVFAFARCNDAGQTIIVISNFTPMPRHDYRIGVPQPGRYRELINTDAAHYGGSGLGNETLHSQPHAAHGRADSISLTLAPLATLFLLCET